MCVCVCVSESVVFFSFLFLYYGTIVEGASTDYGAEQFKKALYTHNRTDPKSVK